MQKQPLKIPVFIPVRRNPFDGNHPGDPAEELWDIAAAYPGDHQDSTLDFGFKSEEVANHIACALKSQFNAGRRVSLAVE